MTMRLIACAALSLTATDAGEYVATPSGGGRIVLDLDDGRLRRVSVALPARCESDNGCRRDSQLAVHLTGDLSFIEGSFRLQGRAPTAGRLPSARTRPTQMMLNLLDEHSGSSA